MTAKLLFTHHAVSRYVQRHARDLTPEEARDVLESEASSAVKLGVKSAKNDADEWEIPSLGLRLLVKPDARQGPTEEPQCVVLTVLPQRRPQEDDYALIATLQAEAHAVFERVKAEREEVKARIVVVRSQSKPRTPPISSLLSKQEELAYTVKIAKLELAAIERWACVLTTETREREKTLRTQLTSDSTLALTKASLRVAIRALVAIDNDEARGALSEIESVHPGFLSPEFWSKPQD